MSWSESELGCDGFSGYLIYIRTYRILQPGSDIL